MYSKLSFGQKLSIWLGCAVVIMIASGVAIYFQMTKAPPKDVESLFNNELFGRRYYTADDWAKEESEANAEIEKAPKSAYWYKKRASARWSLEKYEDAEADYSRAIELDPKDAASLTARASLRRGEEKNDEALADVSKAISIDPNDGWSYMVRSRIYRDMQKFNESLKDADKAVEIETDKRDAYATKAEVYKAMNRIDKAIDTYEKAITYRKTRRADDCFEELVQLYIVTWRLKEAQEASRKWIEEREPSEKAFKSYANICAAMGEKELELEAYKKYLEYVSQQIAKTPTTRRYYEVRARIYDKLSEPEKARFDYLEVLDNSDLEAKNGIFAPEDVLKNGKLFERVGRRDKKEALYNAAIQRYNARLKATPNDGNLYLYRAKIYAAQGKTMAADTDFKSAKKLTPSNTVSHAWAEFALKNKLYPRAFELVLDFLDEEEPRTYTYFAALYEAKGSHERALEVATSALKQDQFLPDAYYWIGKARAGLGDQNESKKRLQQATALGFDPEAPMFDDDEDEEDEEEN